MTTIRERLFNDITSFANNKVDSPIAKALKDDNAISKEDYQNLKNEYAGNDPAKQKEFDDAIASTLGDKVKSLANGSSSEPVTVKFTRFDDNTVVSDNDNDIANNEGHTVVKKDNSEDSHIDKINKHEVLSSAADIIKLARQGKFEEASAKVNSDIRPKSGDIADKVNEKLKEVAKNKAESLISPKLQPYTNILNFDEIKEAKSLLKSGFLNDELKLKLSDRIIKSEGVVTAATNGNYTDISLFGNKFKAPNSPFENANPGQKGHTIPGVSFDVLKYGSVSPLIGTGSGGVKVEVPGLKPFKGSPFRIDVEASVEAGKIAQDQSKTGVSAGIGLKFSIGD